MNAKILLAINQRYMQHGFIKTIILIIVALVILGAMGFDVRDLVEKPVIKNNLLYGWSVLQDVWFSFIEPAIRYVSENVIAPLLQWVVSTLGGNVNN